jgi:coproporphyrinogen III oxidase-like Fe-S oxidoreductase
VETHPLHCQREKREYLLGLRQLGVNRLSIGVQSFDDKVLSVCRRAHDAQQAVEAIAHAKDLGFTVNIDLMTGLPHQTLQTIRNDIAMVEKLRPHAVESIRHDIVNEAMVTFYERNHAMVATKDEMFEAQCLTQEAMQRLGYEQGGTYTAESGQFTYRYLWLKELPLIGFGARTMSQPGSMRYDKHKDISAYEAALQSGFLPVARFRMRSPREQMYRMLFLSLQLKKGFDKQRFFARFGEDADTALAGVLEKLAGYSLIESTAERVTLSGLGRFFGQETSCMITDHALGEIMPGRLRCSVCTDERTNSWLNRRARIKGLSAERTRARQLRDSLKDAPFTVMAALAAHWISRKMVARLLGIRPRPRPQDQGSSICDRMAVLS